MGLSVLSAPCSGHLPIYFGFYFIYSVIFFGCRHASRIIIVIMTFATLVANMRCYICFKMNHNKKSVTRSGTTDLMYRKKEQLND